MPKAFTYSDEKSNGDATSYVEKNSYSFIQLDAFRRSNANYDLKKNKKKT